MEHFQGAEIRRWDKWTEGTHRGMSKEKWCQWILSMSKRAPKEDEKEA